MEQNLVLNQKQILQKIKRIAYQIYENNFEEEKIAFAGINGEGYFFAQLLLEEYQKISNISPKLIKVTFDKKKSLDVNVQIDCSIKEIDNQVVILIDDVLYTGRTLAYGLKPFLDIPLKKIQTAVIVNRSHTNFPIAANYVGYALATTLNEYVDVILKDEEKMGVYIS